MTAISHKLWASSRIRIEPVPPRPGPACLQSLCLRSLQRTISRLSRKEKRSQTSLASANNCQHKKSFRCVLWESLPSKWCALQGLNLLTECFREEQNRQAVNMKQILEDTEKGVSELMQGLVNKHQGQ